VGEVKLDVEVVFVLLKGLKVDSVLRGRIKLLGQVYAMWIVRRRNLIPQKFCRMYVAK